MTRWPAAIPAAGEGVETSVALEFTPDASAAWVGVRIDDDSIGVPRIPLDGIPPRRPRRLAYDALDGVDSAASMSSTTAETPIILIYDPAEEEAVRGELLPQLGSARVRCLPATDDAVADLHDGTLVVTYLGDAPLARILELACERSWVIGLLPHPAMILARRAFGVAERPEDAIDDILQADGHRSLDLFTCNGTPVFANVIVGDPAPLSDDPTAGGLRRLWSRLRVAKSVTLRRFEITTEGGNELDTVALGVMAFETVGKSILARDLVKDAHPRDGMLHALVLAPRSLSEIAGVWLRALLRRGETRSRPACIGHIRTSSLVIRVPGGVCFNRDGSVDEAEDIELRVAAGALHMLPPRHLPEPGGAPETREIFRTQGLPTGEVRDALVSRPLPWRRYAATEEFRDLFQLLRENARASASYLTLMVLSSLLATFGLFSGSGPVIIGAMILAPLMAPIIALAMGVLRQEERFIVRSLETAGLGGALAIGSAAALTVVTPLQTVNAEIAARLHPTLLDLGVAVISGVAGAYAHARAQVARSLAGVAIAVALVPPLAVSGIGLGWMDWSVFSGAFLLFFTNLSGMVLAAALTFYVLGFSPFRRARRGLLVSLAVALVISVPLAKTFRGMVDEHRAISALDGWTVAGVTLQDVTVRVGDPLHVRATLISSRPVEALTLEAVRSAMEERMGRTVRLEAIVAVILDGNAAED